MVDIAHSFTSGTKAQSAQVNTNFATLAAAIKPTFVFTVPGALVTGASPVPALISHGSWTIYKVYAYAKTAPTGANIVVDINKNGTSIWNTTQANRVTITAGSNLGTQTTFDTTSLVDEDIITIDLDTVGSTVSGESLTIEMTVV